MFKTLCTSVMHRRSLRCAALLALAPLVAMAETGSDAGIDPGMASSALYEDVLATLSQPPADSKSGTVGIHIGQRGAAGWRIVQAGLTLDGAEPLSVRYSAEEAEEFASHGGRHRLAALDRLTVARSGLLTVHLVAVPANQTPAERELTLAFTLPPDDQTSTAARAIELLVTGSLIDGPALSVSDRRARLPAQGEGVAQRLTALTSQWRDAAGYRPGSEDDPALAQARLLRATGAVDRAELELLATARDGGGVAAMPMSWWIERLRCAMEQGDLARAERLADEAALLAPRDARLAAVLLELVDRALGDGDLSRAERVLAQARPALSASRRQDGRDLQGRLLLATARNAEAIAALAAGSQIDEALAYGERAGASVSATAYRRFNLAIAMLRQGDEARALSWLDLLGRSQSPLPELVVLRDRANLLMGLHFLKAGRGRIALGVLGRIPVEGPYSDRALLGMGWAMLAPPDTGSSRPVLDEDSQHSDRGPGLSAPLKASLLRLRVLTPELNGAPAPARFETDRSPRRIEDALRAAIAVWQPLAAGNPDNEVAIEGRLAIAYAHDQLGDAAAAIAAYQAVIASLKTQEAALAEAREAVGEGALQHWIATAAAAGPGNTAAVEPRDSALHRLQLPLDDGIGGVHRLVDEAARWQRLQGELDARSQPLPAIELAHADNSGLDVGELLAQGDDGSADRDLAALCEQVDARLAGLKAAAGQRALSLVDTRRAQLRRLQERALFALARLQDDPGIGRGPSAACLRGACP